MLHISHWYLLEHTSLFIHEWGSESLVGTSFVVTTCGDKFSFEEKINFELKVTEFIEVTEDLLYEKHPDWMLDRKVSS